MNTAMANRNDQEVSLDESSTSLSSSFRSSSTESSTKSYVGIGVVGTTIVGTLVLTAPFVLQYLRSPLPYMATPKDKVQKALEFVALRKMTLLQTHKKTSAATTVATQNKSPIQYHFVDLGSGDGEAVYQALQQEQPFVYERAIGIELNSTLWALSQWRRWFLWRGDQRRRSSFLNRDMFTYHLSPPPSSSQPPYQLGDDSATAATPPRSTGTTVMIFGVKPLMKSISQKLARECTEGTHILAYRFPIPLLETLSASDENSTINDSDDPYSKRSAKHPTTMIMQDTDMEAIYKGNDLLLSARLVYDVEEMRVYECLAQPHSHTTRA